MLLFACYRELKLKGVKKKKMTRKMFVKISVSQKKIMKKNILFGKKKKKIKRKVPTEPTG